MNLELAREESGKSKEKNEIDLERGEQSSTCRNGVGIYKRRKQVKSKKKNAVEVGRGENKFKVQSKNEVGNWRR